MSLKIDSKRWSQGFKDGYAKNPPVAEPGDNHSYAAGRVEGEALRLKHQDEYERALFDGRRVRPAPKDPA